MRRIPAALCALFVTGTVLALHGDPDAITAADVAPAAKLADLQYTPAEIALLLPKLEEWRADYRHLRATTLSNTVAPVLRFEPVPADAAAIAPAPRWSKVVAPKRPAKLDALAYRTIAELGAMLRAGQVTASELTDMYLERLDREGPRLAAVVTLTAERARAQAAELDRELASGHDRGPLHGIPYGIKDLFAVADYRTTWGAVPYRDQTLDYTATVVKKLDEAGAILVAKLSLGALAWGDVWFGGTTRNPWNLDEGASGSSAGPAAAVAAGLVPFAIGTETWGSIVSPATRVGVPGLRPTFGRVSRYGAMALAWSMDKVGPLCRVVEDCAFVFDAIRGRDGLDETVVDAPFPYRADIDLSALRIGYLEQDFADDYPGRVQDLAALEVLRGLGARLVPITLPDLPVRSLAFVLSVEAAASFDELTRSGADALMVRQVSDAWPNVFRAARLVPAVEYVQANRVRALLVRGMQTLFEHVDLYVAPSIAGDDLLATNLTGHPAVVVPDGFIDADSPTSITFVGRYQDEATLLAVARRYEQATAHHDRHPPAFP
jgi:Asp-tRNA(Asn)/Glu-tRNA(Gln) amidotransferase A subunit family amidase